MYSIEKKQIKYSGPGGTFLIQILGRNGYKEITSYQLKDGKWQIRNCYPNEDAALNDIAKATGF